MKKGLIGFLAACTLFQFAVVGHSQKVEAEIPLGFTQVLDSSNLIIGGTYYLTDVDDNYVLSTEQKSNNRGVVTFNEDYKTNFQSITLEKGKIENTYALKIDSGYLYAASSSSNHLKIQSTLDENGSWAIEIVDGIASIVAKGSNTRNIMKFNPNNGTPLISCYSTIQDTYKDFHIWSASALTDAELINGTVKKYHNAGTYTKKSNIYVSDTAENFELASVFHKPSNEAPVFKNRTTYYTPTALLMGDYDGGFDDINSGYRNKDGHMWHYSIDSSNEPVNDWKVSNTTIQEFYVTLDKMLEDNYFNGWTYNAGTATYEVESHDDEFVKDFLAFTAPCLEPVVLGNDYENFFDIVKLEIEEGNHLNEGDYLALRMYVDSTNKGVVSNKDCILSEARIYVGNRLFDEDVRNVTINAGEGGTITCNVDISKPVKVGTNLTFTITEDDNYVISSLKFNSSDKLNSIENGQVSWTLDSNLTITATFKSTLVSEDIIFEFGDNGSASHTDGSSKTSYSETNNGYTLTLSSMTNVYTGATDAKGNSCLKLGASSKAGSFSFTVAADVNSVVIKVAGYKANSAKITVNGTSYTVSTQSNSGEYTDITVNTSSTKTVSFTTVSGGYRCMVNSIQFIK